MQITLWDWADEGGPGGRARSFELVAREGGLAGRPMGSSEPFAPWPSQYIRLSDHTWAKAWRYCVHAPGDPLFDDAADDFFANGRNRQDP